MIDSNAGLEHIPDLPPWARPYVERPPVHKTAARLFTLTWDNSKSRTNPSKRDQEKHTCQGVYWPGEPCQIALSNGTGFETMSEMEATLGLAGEFSIEWSE